MPQSTPKGSKTLKRRPQSFTEAVLSDPEARYAYFNTTQGVLAGRPDDEELSRVRALLDSFHIAYLYNPDPTRPQPMFLAPEGTLVGYEQIEQHFKDTSAA